MTLTKLQKTGAVAVLIAGIALPLAASGCDPMLPLDALLPQEDISQTLDGKDAAERSDLKAAAISKQQVCGDYAAGTVEIDIQKIEKIEGGVQVFARAWRDGKQLGFGPDGSVEIERFRIFNPPILVDDPAGDIIRQSVDKRTGSTTIRHLKEDPAEALRASLVAIVDIVGKEDTGIIAGKIGNTTDTFYPSPGSTEDGYVGRFTAGTESWASIRGGTGNESSGSQSGTENIVYLDGNTTNWIEMVRTIFPFDTSALPDGDTISSATFSVFGTGSRGDFFSQSAVAVVSSQASNSAIANSDFQLNAGAALQADTGITFGSWQTISYNDFTLNATGISNISKTGVTHLGVQGSGDQSNTEPTKALKTAFIQGFMADHTGTTNDPMLVVVHTAPASAPNDQSVQLLDS